MAKRRVQEEQVSKCPKAPPNPPHEWPAPRASSNGQSTTLPPWLLIVKTTELAAFALRSILRCPTGDCGKTQSGWYGLLALLWQSAGQPIHPSLWDCMAPSSSCVKCTLPTQRKQTQHKTKTRLVLVSHYASGWKEPCFLNQTLHYGQHVGSFTLPQENMPNTKAVTWRLPQTLRPNFLIDSRRHHYTATNCEHHLNGLC